MSSIKKVALAGASGNLGPAILEQLLQAKFTVTVLTRKDSKSTFPAGVNVAPVDYDSLESLTAALKGQDALVSTLASAAITVQTSLIDAAVAAGVKRIIPSEFGCDTSHPKASKLAVYRGKRVVAEHLEKLAEEGKVTYTFIYTGGFLDWGLRSGFLIGEKYDGGDRPFSASTLATIGKMVAAVLLHPDKSKNRSVHVHDAVVTQNQLAAYAEKANPGKKWQAPPVDTAEAEQLASAELQKPEPNYRLAFYNQIKRAIWGEGYGGAFDHVDNEEFGVPLKSEKEIEQLVAENVKW